jgi:phage tail-like protein
MAAPQHHDPFRTFSFRVELAGLTVAAFTEVSGLESEAEVIEYREGGDGRVRKLPGLRKYANIVLKRGLTQDVELWNWHKDVLEGNESRRNGSVILLDEHGQEAVRWNFWNAWPCRWEGPNLNARSNDVAIETLELAHEGLERA